MKTFENYGVHEMNIKEMKEVDSGLVLLFVGLVVGTLIGFAYLLD